MKRVIFILLTALCALGCTPGNEEYVKAASSVVRVGYEGSTIRVKVSAGGDWYALSDAEWCKATVGGSHLNLEYDTNLGERRSASVVLTCGAAVDTVRVIQLAYNETDYVDVESDHIVADMGADTLRLEVHSNDEWSYLVEQGSEWCSVEKIDGRTLQVGFGVNKGEPRQAIVSLTCGEAETELHITQDMSQQVLVAYYMGSNNLSQMLLDNMEQMESAIAEGALGGHGRVLVFLDRYNGAALYELIDKGGSCSRTMLKNYETIDCTDPEVMSMVLADVEALAPAHHYGFVFGGHGTGWVHKELKMSDMNSFGDWVRKQGVGHGVEHSELWLKSYAEGDWKTRAVGYDGSQAMNVEQLVEGLAELKPDFVLFDACLMGGVEVAWELREVSRYLIASPIEIMIQGFPYTAITKQLFSDWNDLSALCKLFIDHYSQAVMPNAAISLVDLSKLDNLADATADVLASARKVEREWMSSVDSLQYYEGLVNHVYYDLGECVERVATDSVALGRFRTALDEVVLWEGHTEYGYSDYNRGEFLLRSCSGLSVYVSRPERYPKFHTYYNKTGWAQRAGVICANN